MGDTGLEPFQVFRGNARSFEGDDFWGVVWMMSEQQNLECFELGHGRLDDEQYLSGTFELALPPVMGFELWHETGAGSQSRLQDDLGQMTRRFTVGRGYQHDADLRSCLHLRDTTLACGETEYYG